MAHVNVNLVLDKNRKNYFRFTNPNLEFVRKKLQKYYVPNGEDENKITDKNLRMRELENWLTYINVN